MITTWMLYAVLVGGLLGCAARLLELGLSPLRRPTRFVWAGALAALIGLSAAAPFRQSGPELVVPVELASPAEAHLPAVADGDARAATMPVLLREAAGSLLRLAAAPLRRVDGRLVAVVWAALSLLVMCALLATVVHYASLRRRWPVREVAGANVRVAPAAGPAVFGLVRPEIVLPEWLLSAPQREQELVVQHEREHVAAGDQALLAAGSLALVLLPWNPAVWWLLGRLRLAVELDCDARVLRRGAEPLAYGTVLVDIAGRCSVNLRGAAALADTPSHLERRLRAMTERHARFAAARGTALSVIAGAVVLAACETMLPTGPEIEAMDAQEAESLAATLGIVTEAAPRFFVDGIEVADTLLPAPDEIARVEVVRRHAQSASRDEAPAIRITTAAAAEREAATLMARNADDGAPLVRSDGSDASGEAARRETVRRLLTLRAGHELTADSLEPVVGARAAVTSAELRSEGLSGRATVARDFNGILMIDGVIVDPSALRRLSPDAIEHVEIIKGAAATRLFPHAAAANGVIRITTKPQR